MQTLPEAFVRQLTISLGPERAGEVVSFITGSPASTAVRINPFKVNAFPAQFASGRETFSRWGRLLDGRPEFALDPLFHAGAYYVQEASSMYLESILPLMLRMSRLVSGEQRGYTLQGLGALREYRQMGCGQCRGD